MTDTHEELRSLGRRWVDAELHGDADTLDAITTDDFTLVGPLGFVLPKAAWLERFRSATLHFESLEWDELLIRTYGQCAIVIGRQQQVAYHDGNPNPGQFRATHTYVHDGEDWLLAGMHIGPLTPSPSTKPMP